MSYTEYPPMPEEHETILRKCLDIDEKGAIPDEILRVYWDVERTNRRSGLLRQVTDQQLVMILVFTGRTAAERVSTILDAELQYGDPLVVEYRGKPQFGKFVQKTSNKIVATIDMDPEHEEREFLANKVRLPTKEEVQLLES